MFDILEPTNFLWCECTHISIFLSSICPCQTQCKYVFSSNSYHNHTEKEDPLAGIPGTEYCLKPFMSACYFQLLQEARVLLR